LKKRKEIVEKCWKKGGFFSARFFSLFSSAHLAFPEAFLGKVALATGGQMVSSSGNSSAGSSAEERVVNSFRTDQK